MPPFVGVAVNVTDVPVQVGLVPDVKATATLGVTLVVNVIVMLFDEAVKGLAHAELEVIVQVITSLFANEAFVYVALFVPTFVPFNFHWYAGVVPPLVGVAVKVTVEPEQNGLLLAAIATAGTTEEVTVIVIAFDVAVGVVAQAELEVTTHVITSLFVIETGVNVAALVPAFTPFTIH